MEQAPLLKRLPFNPPVRGDMVGPYRVVAPLGVGGNGYVYKVERAGRFFALKLLGIQALDARGQREIDILRHVRHPHVVRFVGCDRWPVPVHGYLYIVMELVEGRTLGQWVLEENPSAREVVRVFLILLRTLTDLHAQGVLHRDLKGDNILLRAVDGEPVLVDFGTGWLEGEPPLTRGGPSPFTPEYRSPESVRYEREHAAQQVHYSPDAGDELWAAGVVLYHLLTDWLPFGTRYDGELFERIVHERPKAPRELNPRVPAALSALCLRMLEKERAARFATCGEVVQALEAALAGADAGWDVPLVDPLASEWLTTQEAPGLVSQDAAEREAHRWNVARPRRGQKAAALPAPVHEDKGAAAMESPAPRQESPTAQAPGAPPATPAPPAPVKALIASRAAVLAAVVLGLLVLAGLGAWRALAPGGWTPRRPTLQATGVREVAGPVTPAEAGAGAAASLASTPAPQPATMPRKPDSRSTAKETPAAQRKGLSARLAKKCVGAACCTALGACSGGAPQVRPAVYAPLPKPAACPDKALKAMKDLDIPMGDNAVATFPYSGRPKDHVSVTQFTSIELRSKLGKLRGGTLLSGQLFFTESRVYGRFTLAQTPGGPSYPVCLELAGRLGCESRGVEREDVGGPPSSAEVIASEGVCAVRRFE